MPPSACARTTTAALRRQARLLQHLRQPSSDTPLMMHDGGVGTHPAAVTVGPNRFKVAIAAREKQIGIWCGLGSALGADILADSGYDWVLLDTEHSPQGPPEIFDQLLALDRSDDTSPVVRPPWNDSVQFKKLLDIGARTLLVPYVSTAEEAREAVARVRYPTKGIRGVAGTTRATRYGRNKDYLTTASDDICLLVQIETLAGIENLDAIAEVDGVDGVFIGPADLSAALGYIHDRNHPVVIETIKTMLARITAAGKPAGILTVGNPEQAKMWLELGFTFVAVDYDMSILAREADRIRKLF
jgi:4-hydroxy-2-oxoheptanedioate aldolase